jgi:hypothetical protein
MAGLRTFLIQFYYLRTFMRNKSVHQLHRVVPMTGRAQTLVPPGPPVLDASVGSGGSPCGKIFQSSKARGVTNTEDEHWCGAYRFLLKWLPRQDTYRHQQRKLSRYQCWWLFSLVVRSKFLCSIWMKGCIWQVEGILIILCSWLEAA